MVQDNNDFDALADATVFDSEGKKVGTIGDVYYDDQTGQPAFVSVNTGLFGMKETFVPYDAANRTADGLTVPFTKDFIKDAPNVDADGHLTPEEERRVFEHYRLEYDGAAGTGMGDRAGTAGDVGRAGAPGTAGGPGNVGAPGTAGDAAAADRAGRDADHDMVAHEERLRVGTETREAGQARLRKRVRTEHQNVEVPVQREELVVEREAVDPDAPGARSDRGIRADGDEEEVVTLHEERPVVDKETVATERVSAGTRTVTDTENVQGEVSKEDIEVEETADPRRDRRDDRPGGRH